MMQRVKDATFSVVLSPVSLLFPSNMAGVDRTKLVTIGTLFATFFLFTAKLYLPGGAESFVFYADAIVKNSTLNSSSSAFQRDAGYPLLIILSGYPFLHSFIFLLIIQAAFAAVLSLLIFESLRRLAPRTAFYTGLASTLALSPYLFMKMIHHDQSYIFFEMLTLCMILVFLQTKQTPYLYLMTVAAIFTSVVRPAGNILFPIIIAGCYVVTRGRIQRRHYFTCVILFAIALGAYSWHRYVIFDVKNVDSSPSYTGTQTFYDPYVNSLDYEIRLWPRTVGSNFARVVKNLQAAVGPENEAAFIQNSYVGGDKAAAAFAQVNMLPFTGKQLIDRVIESPNYEYFSLLSAANADDQVMLRAALEIARAYPSLLWRYTTRNLFHFIFDPGYTHSRYSVDPFGPEDLVFLPSLDVVAADAVVSLTPRAVREVDFNNSFQLPSVASSTFGWLEKLWLEHYRQYVVILSFFMCVAWVTMIAGLARYAIARRAKVTNHASKEGKHLPIWEKLIPCIFMASLLFCYDAFLTALFAEPDFRYRQLADLQAFVIAGLGVISLQRGLDSGLGLTLQSCLPVPFARLARLLGELDLWRRLSSIQLVIWIACLVIAGFGGWSFFMLMHTAAS
jgi:hypothetical protein